MKDDDDLDGGRGCAEEGTVVVAAVDAGGMFELPDMACRRAGGGAMPE